MRFLTTAAFWAYFTTSSLDGAAAQQGGLRRKLVAKRDCTFMVAEALAIDGGADHDDDMSLECELDPEDADGYGGIHVELDVDKEQKKELKKLMKEDKAIPGKDKISIAGLDIDGGKVKVPKGKKMFDVVKQNNGKGNGYGKDKRRRLAATNASGDLNMLLIRVTDVNGLVHADPASTMR